MKLDQGLVKEKDDVCSLSSQLVTLMFELDVMNEKAVRTPQWTFFSIFRTKTLTNPVYRSTNFSSSAECKNVFSNWIETHLVFDHLATFSPAKSPQLLNRQTDPAAGTVSETGLDPEFLKRFLKMRVIRAEFL